MANLPRHGRSAYFALVSGGSTCKLSSAADDVTFTRKVDTAEVSTFGVLDKQYLVGLRDNTVKVAGNWTSTKDIFITSILGATGVTFVYGPESTAAGREKKIGACFISDYETKTPLTGRAAMSLTLQCSGTITSTNF